MYALPVKCAGTFLQSLGMHEDDYYNELHTDHQCLKVLHSNPATSELINAINDFIIAYAKMNKLLLKSPAVAKDFTKIIND